ncbi:hypothetical protein Tco_1040051 [Tanacetum coccineum]
MFNSFTSSMCIDSWGWSSFARCLIKVRGDVALKDSVTIGIPLPEGEGFTKETVQVENEWKPPCCDQWKIFSHVYDQCPKNVIVVPNVEKINNDRFQTMVNKRKCYMSCLHSSDHTKANKNRGEELENGLSTIEYGSCASIPENVNISAV